MVGKLKKTFIKYPILRDLILLGILLLLSVWAGKGIFKYGVFSTHDGNHHLARSFDAIQTIKEGHFPLRWAGSLNYSCGVPVFNFFYPLIYYLVIIINLVVGEAYLSLKIISFLSLLVGTTSFYLWTREETKRRLPSFAGALLYLFAPYRFSLIFVRGSPEFLAYAIFPLVLYFYSLSFNARTNRKFILYIFFATITGGLLTISHNFTVMFLMPIILIYLIAKIVAAKKIKIKKIALISFSYISIFALGTFFILPALIEKKFTRLGTARIVNYKDHFPTLAQLIRSKWGYFYSMPGVENDGMSFMLGYAQWFILALVLGWLIYKYSSSRKKSLKEFVKKNLWQIAFFILSLLLIFLILPWSMFIWDSLPLLQEIQFSWRILGVAIFSISVLLVIFLKDIEGKWVFWPIFLFIIFLAIFGNRNHLLPQPASSEETYLYSDFEKLHYFRYVTTTLGDDILNSESSQACYYDTPLISVDGGEEIDFVEVDRGNTFGAVRFRIDKTTYLDTKILLGLEYFPDAYKFEINGLKNNAYLNCNGRVCFEMNNFNDGENLLTWQIKQTSIQSLSNWITAVFIAVWLMILAVGLLNKKKMISKKNIRILFILTLVFALFAFLRFYRLPERAVFNWDQERDAYVIKQIITEKKLTLIGPRVLGPEGFFLPPYFFYLLVPFYLLTSLNPMSIVLFIISYSSVFFLVSYYLLSKIFSKTAALIFLLMWAIHPLSISFDIIAWNPIIIPLMIIFLLYLISKYIQTKNNRMFFLIGLVFGLGISFHVQFALLAPLILVLYYWKPWDTSGFITAFKKATGSKPVDELNADMSSSFGGLVRRRRTGNPTSRGGKDVMKQILLTALGLFIVFIPLVIFDLRHGFLNSKLFIDFLSGGSVKNPLSFLPVWENYVTDILIINANRFIGIVFYIVVAILAFSLAKLSDKESVKRILLGLGLSWVLFPLFFLLYGSRPSEYYFNYLFVIFAILIAYFVSWLLENYSGKMKIIVSALVIVVVALGLISKRNFIYRFDSLFNKTRTARFVSLVGKNTSPYNLSFSVPLGEDSGYRYLLEYYKAGYTKNNSDPLLRIIIPPNNEGTFTIGNTAVHIPKSWLDENWVK